MTEKVYVTYNQVHKLCQKSAPQILTSFQPNLIIAIGGGGYVPARILRSFLKQPGGPNIPIQAIGLSLYEQLPASLSGSASAATLPAGAGAVGAGSGDKVDDDAVSAGGEATTAPTETDIEQPGTKVTRTQWLDLSSLEMANLIGRNVLIVDEVDDTRTTLEYAVRELMKDVEEARKLSGRTGEEARTRFSVFVLHNKDKVKRGALPRELVEGGRYLAAVTVPDSWLVYPWESKDIDEHDRLAASQEARQG